MSIAPSACALFHSKNCSKSTATNSLPTGSSLPVVSRDHQWAFGYLERHHDSLEILPHRPILPLEQSSLSPPPEHSTSPTKETRADSGVCILVVTECFEDLSHLIKLVKEDLIDTFKVLAQLTSFSSLEPLEHVSHLRQLLSLLDL